MQPRDATRTYDPDERWSHLADRVARATDPFTALRADQVAQWAAGDPVPAEEYLKRFPQLTADDRLALVVAEIGLRHECGETLDLVGYQTRFPTMADDLMLQCKLLSALAEKPVAGQHAQTIDGPTHSPAGTASALPEIPGFDFETALGEGAMGEVYRARQVRLNRVVALKMVHGERRVGPKDLIRFLAEAEAVAAVKHPHVMQVHEYGEHAGRPYLVLEYLSGGTLAERLKDRGRLPPAEAPKLLAKLAHGVHAAHQKGIVHRDLKPGNVLFDEAGEPKVADFGLAKRGTGSDLTGSVAVMGTPAYMSPEQARGESKFVGPAADVWALGVILYECLTGTRPFDADLTAVLLARVQSVEPTKLRKHVPDLPRDLELICLKCLEKEPAQRYRSASELADDLERFLNDAPVSARPPSWWYSTRKFVRRHRVPVAVTAFVMLLLVGGIIGTSWGLVRALDAEEHARDEQGKTNAALIQVQDEQGKTQAALDRVTKEQAATQAALTAETKALGQVRAALSLLVSETAGDLLTNRPSLTAQERLFFEGILTAFKRYADQRGNTPDEQELQADAHARVGMLYVRLGDYRAAETSLRTALQLRETLAQAQPSSRDHKRRVLTSRNLLANVFSRSGRAKEALEMYGAAGRDMMALLKSEDNVEDRYFLGGVMMNAANELTVLNQLPTAAGTYAHAVATLEPLAQARPRILAHAILYGKARLNAATTLIDINQPAKSESELRALVPLWQELDAAEPRNRDIHYEQAKTQFRLGDALARQKKLAEAQQFLTTGLEGLESLVARYPGDLELMIHFGHFLSRLGVLKDMADDSAGVDETCSRAIRILEPLVKQDRSQLLAASSLRLAYTLRGHANFKRDRHDQAAEDWRLALAAGGPGVEAELRTLRSLALAGAGKFPAALAEAKAVEATGKLDSKIQMVLAMTYAMASYNAQTEGDPGEAERLAKVSLDLIRQGAVAGYFQTESAKDYFAGAPFTYLRERPEFKQLAAEYEKQELMRNAARNLLNGLKSVSPPPAGKKK